MRHYTYTLALILASSCLWAEPPVILPGNPAIPAENYRSPLWDALDIWERQIVEHDHNTSNPQVAAALQTIIRALEQGGNPNDYAVHDAVYITPLIIAAQQQDLPLLRLLLEKGADPNRPENKDLAKTVITTDCPAILLLLIEKGWKFNPNLPGGCDAHICGGPSLPLIWAIWMEKYHIVETLLKLGADPYLTETSNPEWAKRAEPGWQPSKENAFQTCEQITRRSNPAYQAESQANQAKIQLLLNRYKNGKKP